MRSDGGEPVDPLDILQPDESGYLREHRVLSKGVSGGGFLVPTELADRITSAARAAGVLARVAAEFVTESGATFNAPVASHGTGAWIAESGSYTPSDETITNVSLSAFKGGTKIIVSEELLLDESAGLPDFLAGELGSRLGALQENAFVLGDGSGKPLGITNAGAGYTAVTAATGSSTAFKLPAPAANAKSAALGAWGLAYGIRRVRDRFAPEVASRSRGGPPCQSRHSTVASSRS